MSSEGYGNPGGRPDYPTFSDDASTDGGTNAADHGADGSAGSAPLVAVSGNPASPQAVATDLAHLACNGARLAVFDPTETFLTAMAGAGLAVESVGPDGIGRTPPGVVALVDATPGPDRNAAPVDGTSLPPSLRPALAAEQGLAWLHFEGDGLVRSVTATPGNSVPGSTETGRADANAPVLTLVSEAAWPWNDAGEETHEVFL